MLSITRVPKRPGPPAPSSAGFPWMFVLLTAAGVTLIFLTDGVEVIQGTIAAWVGVVGLGVAVFIVFSLYFIPTIVAVVRSHRQILAIGMLNTLVGWTFVAWVIALVWACTQVP